MHTVEANVEIISLKEVSDLVEAEQLFHQINPVVRVVNNRDNVFLVGTSLNFWQFVFTNGVGIDVSVSLKHSVLSDFL